MSFGGWDNDDRPSSSYPKRGGSYQNPTSNPFDSNYGQGQEDEFEQVYVQNTDFIRKAAKDFQQTTQLVQSLGGPADGKKLRDGIAVRVKEMQDLQNDIRKNITRLSNLSTKGDSSKRKTRKEQVDTLTENFDAFSSKVTQLCNIANQKMREVSVPSSSSFQQYADDPEQQRLLDERYQQAHMILDQNREWQDGLIHDRDTEITSVRDEMKQVNEIFKGIAGMIVGQAPMVDSIANNISASAGNTKAAVGSIVEAEEEQSSERSKLCWFAAIVSILIIIIVIIVVVVLKVKK